MHFLFRQAKKIVILVVGSTVVLLGLLIILIPGPGPAPLVILGGLAILATEFVWAAVFLKRARAVAERTADRLANAVPVGGRKADDEHPSLLRRLIRKIPMPKSVTDDDSANAGAGGPSGKLPGMGDLIITLDGPAGSGKSSVARILAGRLGLEFLDTGAMYRGVTAACLALGIDPAKDRPAAVELAKTLRVSFDWAASPPKLLIEIPGKPTPAELEPDRLADRLRDPDVTRAVSYVAQAPEIRQVLVAAQRRIGVEHPRLVTEGRDQGSVVFPQARHKFYLTARPEVRAKRRCEELRNAKKPADEAQVLHDILLRDRLDRERSDGPLIRPADAIDVDTSDMSREQVVAHLESLVRRNAEAAPTIVVQASHRAIAAGSAAPGSGV